MNILTASFRSQVLCFSFLHSTKRMSLNTEPCTAGLCVCLRSLWLTASFAPSLYHLVNNQNPILCLIWLMPSNKNVLVICDFMFDLIRSPLHAAQAPSRQTQLVLCIPSYSPRPQCPPRSCWSSFGSTNHLSHMALLLLCPESRLEISGLTFNVPVKFNVFY